MRSIEEILEVIDDGLASYDEYRRQLDAERQVETHEALVISGLDKAVKQGLITPEHRAEDIDLMHGA